jgi:hypothetical protein
LLFPVLVLPDEQKMTSEPDDQEDNAHQLVKIQIETLESVGPRVEEVPKNWKQRERRILRLLEYIFPVGISASP